jgi:exosortase
MSSIETPEPLTGSAKEREQEQPAARPNEYADMTFRDLLHRIKPVDIGVYIAVALLFINTIKDVWSLWSYPDAPQSYGLLIVPASAALVWMLRGRLYGVPVKPSNIGIGLLILGIFFQFVGSLAVAITLNGIAFVIVMAGIVMARYGTAVARVLWFPIAYLVAMIPLPSEILNLSTFPLQRISIRWASLILRPFGDVKVEGTQLHFGGFALNVIAPCSGLTILLPLVVLAAFYLYIIVAPAWKKATLAVIVVPLAMVVNAVRVALIAVVGEAMGQHVADSFHDYSGLITVALGFGALMLIAREIKCDQIADDIQV